MECFVRSVLGPVLDHDASRQTELEATLRTFSLHLRLIYPYFDSEAS
ncbi:hypothetical protein SAMN05216377_1232 [Pseudonocardia oroxyli]|uniref:Uncharacterized protein n=1 Tax=Pseudonocardia oroxyli TaxID=366584 RepID=A0A1G8CMH2_PSEOR|nr:hypothetical protein SAMN05216377_1232 [Pseudonocardia oroxyli]